MPIFINLIPNAFGSKCRPVPSFRYSIKQIVQHGIAKIAGL